MCTEVNEFGKEVYTKYINKNLGDPGLFLGTTQLEEELIDEIGEIFNGKNIIGTFTTGGSEANIIAMRISKKLRPDIEKPEVGVYNVSKINRIGHVIKNVGKIARIRLERFSNFSI